MTAQFKDFHIAHHAYSSKLVVGDRLLKYKPQRIKVEDDLWFLDQFTNLIKENKKATLYLCDTKWLIFIDNHYALADSKEIAGIIYPNSVDEQTIALKYSKDIVAWIEHIKMKLQT